MIDRKSLAVKIASGYLIAIIVLTIVVLFNLYRSSELQLVASDIVEHQVPGVNASLDVVINVEHSLSAIRGWVALGESKYKDERQQAWKGIDHAFQKLNTIARQNDNRYLLSDLNVLQSDLEQLRSYQQDVEQIAHTLESKPGLKMLTSQVVPLTNKLIKLTTQLIDEESKKSQITPELQRLLAKFRFQFAQCISALRIYLITNQEAYLSEFDNNWEQNEQVALQLQNLVSRMSSQQKVLLQELMLVRDEFIQYPDQLFDYRQSPEWDLAKLRTNSWIGPLAEKIKNQINAIVATQNRSMQGGFESMLTGFDLSINLGIALLLLGIVLSTALVFVLIQLIVKPVNQVIAAANRISQGDFSVEVDISGTLETERLGVALKNMTLFLRRIANHATLLAQGNFDVEFTPQSEQDHLSQALSSMTQHLKENQQRNEQQNWLKSGIATITDKLKGIEELEQVCHQGLEVIAHYLKADAGALYLCDQQSCHLLAGYAFTLDGQMKKNYPMGQGLVGQAALKAAPLTYHFKTPDESLLKIHTGLADVSATHVVVNPISNSQLSNNQVNAVIVLALAHECSELELELFTQMSESLSISIDSAQSRAKLESLLSESQQQAKELQTQQEELRLFNEELEQQAQSLKVSEEELQAQGDELKQNNHRLEQQKHDLEQKNAEIKSAHQALEQKAEELDQTSQFKSEFMANMSHELRTPLNCLLILSQALAKNPTDNLEDEQISDLEFIYQSGQTLLSLINDILDLSKIEAGKLVPEFTLTNTSNLLQYLEKLFHPVAEEKGVSFELEKNTDCPESFVTDEHRLHQILRNLLSNAFKFTQNGFVRLTISAAPTESELSGPGIKIEVEDSGIGITPQAQKVIFEAFQQADGSTSRSYGGSGLGLTISRELASLLGGEISLTSTSGVGSCFSLTLPYAQPREAGEVTTQQSSPEALIAIDDRETIKVGDKAVLIAVNSTIFAQEIKSVARQQGFYCLHATTGQQALALTQQYQPKAIVLDLEFPDIIGIDVLNKLKATPETVNIPVHIIARTQEHVTLMRQQAIEVIAQPIDKNKLKQILGKFTTLIQQNIQKVLYLGAPNQENNEIIETIEQLGTSVSVLIYPKNKTQWQALNRQLAEQHYQCLILDVNQHQLTANKELQPLQQLEYKHALPPLIIYRHLELSESVTGQLTAYAAHIDIQNSEQRINDEIECFLHSVNEHLPVSGLSELVQQGDIDLAERKILLVDDDLRNTYALSKVLKNYGMEINIADNGALALEKIDQGKHFDLILMDIMMPEMDGYEAMRRIRSDFASNVPIIALTAKAMSDDREKCIEAGANDYLAKPVDMEQLLTMIKVWICK